MWVLLCYYGVIYLQYDIMTGYQICALHIKQAHGDFSYYTVFSKETFDTQHWYFGNMVFNSHDENTKHNRERHVNTEQ